jgi:hypothetical protein
MQAAKFRIISMHVTHFFMFGKLKCLPILFLFICNPFPVSYAGSINVILPVNLNSAADTGKVKKEGVKTDKKKSTIKKSEIKESDDLINDDDDDEDIYTPYSKWRIDKFDNWGKHKKKNASATVPDEEDTDTSKVKKDNDKEFKDNEKESFLIYPSDFFYETKEALKEKRGVS